MATSKSEMTDAEIIQLINGSIRKVENWTIGELANGKEVDVFPEWQQQLHSIVSQYRMKKWNVYWMRNGKRQYLQFENPWRKK